jgi:hypothetical protein
MPHVEGSLQRAFESLRCLLLAVLIVTLIVVHHAIPFPATRTRDIKHTLPPLAMRKACFTIFVMQNALGCAFAYPKPVIAEAYCRKLRESIRERRAECTTH